MDTLTRSTLIARSMRSLSGVLVASILSIYATPGSATPSELTPSNAPDPALSTVSNDDTAELLPQADPYSVSTQTDATEIDASNALDDLSVTEAAETDSADDTVTPPEPVQSGELQPYPSQPQTNINPFQALPNSVLSQPEIQPSYEDSYVLGPQDEIQVDVFNVPEFSGDNGAYTILVDGSVNFPWVGSVNLAGLTLSQAADRLEQAYAPYINNPLITVSVTRPRAIRISVVGEVNRPGSYTVDPIERVNRGGTAVTGEGNNQWTSLVQAIQIAGGITQTADVRDIQIRRPTRAEDDQIINVSLWDLLQQGDTRQDIALRDGDTVFVPTAISMDPNEAIEVAAANFSPDVINTYVVGEVKDPGVLELRPNSTLNQALLAAGGFEDDRAGKVQLIRLNPDGTVEKRDIDVDLAADLNDETNPTLRDRDIVLVRRSSGAQVVDFIDTLISPVADIVDGVFGIFPIWDLFDNGD